MRGINHIGESNAVYSIGLEGSFGNSNIGPRELSVRYLNKTVAIEGIITKCTLDYMHISFKAHSYAQRLLAVSITVQKLRYSTLRNTGMARHS